MFLLARICTAPSAGAAAGRRRAASRPTEAMLPSHGRPAPHRDCSISRRPRNGGAAMSLRRFHLLPQTSTSTSAAAAAALAPSSAGSAGLALLALSGAAAQASQAHPWGARLSSPLVAMLLGGLAAAAFPSALPSASAASASASAAAGLASAVSGTLVPLAACLALLEIDGSSSESGAEGERPESEEEKRKTGDKRMDPTLAVSVSFALASLATVAATLVAVSLCFFARAASSSPPPQLPFFLSSILPSEALLPRPLLVKVAACLCASYIGGSINFAATAAALGLSSSPQGAQAMAAAFAADLVAMALYFGALAALKAPREEEAWARGGGGAAARGGGEASKSSSSNSSSTSSPSPLSSISTLSAALSLAAAACSVAVGETFAAALGCPPASLAVAALVASAFGLAGREVTKRRRKNKNSSSFFAGASAASSALMLLFFASCGAQAGSPSSLRAAASLGGFVALLLALQLAATLALGRGVWMAGGGALRLLGLRSSSPHLPLPALVVGANAAVGGPGTAAAAAAARSWGRLVRPAVLAGSAGYAVGTGVGVAVAAALSRAFC